MNSKRIQVEHITTYEYENDVELAHHLAYLRPINSPYQEVIQSQLLINPEPDTHHQNFDIYGNQRDLFSFHKNHQSLSVEAHCEVLTKEIPKELLEMTLTTWEEVRELLRYEANKLSLPAAEFIYPSPFAPYAIEIHKYAQESFTPGRKIIEASIDLCTRIFTDFKYSPNSTKINTPVWEAFKNRAGVCQDFAHIFIVAIRSLGLSARYVSGYLLTTPPPGQEKMRGADASHAWASIYCPGIPGDWLELDPTNNVIAGNNHIRLALGRDFGDVSPIKGVIRSGGNHKINVQVTAEEI